MVPRRVLRAVALSVMTVLLITIPQAAHAAGQVVAQPKELPPKYEDLRASTPWTYLLAYALLAGAVLMIIATLLGYLVKGRQFRANQRRGGSK
jgi:ABC-type Fe3+ transport system permease subunit